MRAVDTQKVRLSLKSVCSHHLTLNFSKFRTTILKPNLKNILTLAMSDEKMIGVTLLYMLPTKNIDIQINPQAPVAQKSADEVVFRHFQGEGVGFFKSDISWLIPI